MFGAVTLEMCFSAINSGNKVDFLAENWLMENWLNHFCEAVPVLREAPWKESYFWFRNTDHDVLAWWLGLADLFDVEVSGDEAGNVIFSLDVYKPLQTLFTWEFLSYVCTIQFDSFYEDNAKLIIFDLIWFENSIKEI